MTPLTADELITHGLALPESERLAVADQLLASVKPSGVLSEDDPNFEQELQRRIKEVDSGRAVLIDGEVSLKLARQRLDKMREL